MEEFDLRKGTQYQGPLVIRHEDGQVISLPHRMPVKKVIRCDAIDKNRKLVGVFSIPPPLLPFLDESLNFFRLSPFIAPIGISDCATEKRDGG